MLQLRVISAPVSIPYSGVSVMVGGAVVTLWLMLAGYDLKDLSVRTITCLTGYLRSRPDPALEAVLRDAFARFDRDLESLTWR